MPSYVRPGIRKCAKNRALSQGEKASADCGHEYRQFEPNVDDNVVVGEVFKKYVET